jgi:hypothetical protein
LEKVREASWDKLVHYEIVPDERIITTHLLENGYILKFIIKLLGKQVVSYSDDFYATFHIIAEDAFGFS